MSARNVTKVTKQVDVVDNTTGEILTTTTQYILSKEPDFVKLYISSISMLTGLSSKREILDALLAVMDYKNRITLSSTLKKEIAAECGLSVKSVDNALNILLKKNIIFRRGTGSFMGNPQLFGRGEWKDIHRMRITLLFDKDGSRMSTEVTTGSPSAEGISEEVQDAPESIKAERREIEQDAPESIKAERREIEQEEAVLNSAVIPGLTVGQLHWLQKVIDANTVPICLFGLLASSVYSIQQLVQIFS